MNNKIIIGIVLVLLVVVGGGAYLLMQKPNYSTQQPSQQPTQQPSTQVQANTITIKNFSFMPDPLTVKQGTKVTWVNEDSTTHTVNSSIFNSSELSRGDKFEFTFSTKGTFNYSCGLHPTMTGKVIVE